MTDGPTVTSCAERVLQCCLRRVNKVVWSNPLGLSAEVVGRAAVDWCDRNLTTRQYRELVAN